LDLAARNSRKTALLSLEQTRCALTQDHFASGGLKQAMSSSRFTFGRLEKVTPRSRRASISWSGRAASSSSKRPGDGMKNGSTPSICTLITSALCAAIRPETPPPLARATTSHIRSFGLQRSTCAGLELSGERLQYPLARWLETMVATAAPWSHGRSARNLVRSRNIRKSEARS